MHTPKNELQMALQDGELSVQLDTWDSLTAVYFQLPAGTDLAPALQGLPDDSCQCPHWGYVIEGRLNLRYSDGTEETIEAGDLFFLPPGHTARVDEDTKYIDFSPTEALYDVLNHIKGQGGD